jgi:STE24 endopeptidase
MNQVTFWFLIALAASTVLQLWLALRQIGHVASHRDALPASFAGKISPDAHRKAADYTVAKTRFSIVNLLYENALRLFWTLGGGLALLDGFWRVQGLDTIATGVAVIVSALFLMSLLELPFSAWYTFSLEERFGFNHTKVHTFIGDLIKQGLIALIVGIPLAWTVLWLMAKSGDLWWIYVWAVWIGFSLLMMWLYPALIAPLFNKFTPLDDASLKDRIESLLAKCGFSSRGIFVMDGSKRSGGGTGARARPFSPQAHPEACGNTGAGELSRPGAARLAH